jgi:hypothetical protein
MSNDISKPEEFTELSELFNGYLHQDLYICNETISSAIKDYAIDINEHRKEKILKEIDVIVKKYLPDPNTSLPGGNIYCYSAASSGMKVPEFFDMVRAILADPECYRQFNV